MSFHDSIESRLRDLFGSRGIVTDDVVKIGCYGPRISGLE